MTKKDIIEKIIIPIENAGFKAFFVGGCVRDQMMGVEPHDYDICTDVTPEELHKIFKHFSEQKSEQFGVTMPIVDGELIEIATMRKDITKGRHPKIEFTRDIAEDAMRRDFTINALYEDKDGNVLDPTGFGIADIKLNTLRFVGTASERVMEDPLRLFRFVRFISQKGFIPYGPHIDACDSLVLREGTINLFKEVSKERQLKELIGIFGGKYFGPGIFDYMNKCGILSVTNLDEIFSDMEHTPQTPKWHAEGNVLNHTMLVVKEMCEILKEREYADNHERFLMVLAALLHDIGKPEAGRRNGCKPGRDWPDTKGHDFIGCDLAYNFCKSIGMSNEDSELIKWLVANHMLAHNISKSKSKYKIWKLIEEPSFFRLLDLSIADSKGSIHTEKDETPDLCEYIKFSEVEELFATPMPKPLVTGDDLIELGIKPNKNFRKALEVGYEMQINQGAQKQHILSNIKNLAKE